MTIEMAHQGTAQPTYVFRKSAKKLYQRFQRGVLMNSATTGQTQWLLAGDLLKRAILGSDVPADLARDAAGSRFVDAFAERPLGLVRPASLAQAFTVDSDFVSAQAAAAGTVAPILQTATSVSQADRKAFIRQLVQRVVLAAHPQSEQVQVTLEWVSGGQTQTSVVRPVARLEQLSYHPQLCARAQQLAAARLTMRELAHALEMPHVTLYTWLKRGWITARREPRPPHRWIVRANAAEQERLHLLHRRSLSQDGHQRWCARPLRDQLPPADSDRSAARGPVGSSRTS
jgi:hypothetical protein